MDVLVDDAPCPLECRPAERFGSLMDRLRSTLAREGRIIVSLEIDGEAPSPERLAELEGEAVDALPPVRIRTDSPVAGAASILRRLDEALPLLREEQERTVAGLEAGQRADAMAAFARCVEFWEALQRTVVSVALLVGGDFVDPDDPTGDIAGASESLRDALRKVQDTLKAGDLVALGDVIEADLGPLTDRWQGVLAALARRLSDQWPVASGQ